MRRGVVMWKTAYDPAELPRKRPEDAFDAWKPDGVWYSPGEEWLDWCARAKPDWLTEHVYELVFNDERLLRVRSHSDLVHFHNTYATTPLVAGSELRVIDWPAVAREYDGIEIAPYQRTARHDIDMFWYYTWDVASGVLWNRSAIVSVEPYAPSTVPVRRQEAQGGG